MGGFIGGAMAAGLGDAAGQVVSNSQQALDLQNKQQMAQFQSGLDQDREAAQLRLQQSIGTEQAISTANGPIAAAVNAGADTKAKSEAATWKNNPDVRSAAEDKATLGPEKMSPGQQLFVKNPDGSYTQKADNKNMTAADARFAVGTANGGAKANNFTAKERDDALTSVQTQVDKQYIDSMGKPLPTANAVASKAFIDGMNSGLDPASARVQALDAANRVQAAAKLLLASPQGKSMDMDSAMGAVVEMARQKAAANAGPQDRAPAPAPAPGLLNNARKTAPDAAYPEPEAARSAAKPPTQAAATDTPDTLSPLGSLANKSLIELDGIANGRGSPAAKAAAKAEMARRKAAPDSRGSDPQTDPALYANT